MGQSLQPFHCYGRVECVWRGCYLVRAGDAVDQPVRHTGAYERQSRNPITCSSHAGAICRTAQPASELP